MPDAPSSPLVHLQPGELSPAVRGLLQSFVSRGAAAWSSARAMLAGVGRVGDLHVVDEHAGAVGAVV